jgi:hypothetical protein
MGFETAMPPPNLGKLTLTCFNFFLEDKKDFEEGRMSDSLTVIRATEDGKKKKKKKKRGQI